MKKNILIILNIFIIISFIWIYYYENNKLVDCSKRECINTFSDQEIEKDKQVIWDNESSLTKDDWDLQETKQTLSFDEEVDYIKNNIDNIVSDFEEKPTNWNWYAVDIRFIKTWEIVATSKWWEYTHFSNAIVIFEDGHYSYLVKLEKGDNWYNPVWYYDFVQRPDEMVWWKQIWTDEYLDIWEVIYHWSI